MKLQTLEAIRWRFLHLYKYLNVRGAKLTLGNGTFKHAKPSDFNDVEDLTIRSIFPEEIEIALQKLSNGITDVFLRHLDDAPTCGSPMSEHVALIQEVLRNNPDAAAIVKAALKEGESGPIYDVEYMRKRADEFVREINDFMQGYRIFCVTMYRDSEQMWSRYAEGHKGIALRIEPSSAKDSKFKLLRPVEYREMRPPFFSDTIEFIAGSLFGNQQARIKEAVERIIYSKTLAWQFEGEYRLAMALRPGEPPWDTDKYYPEEITELFLGLAMSDEDRKEIIFKARALNSTIAIFQVRRCANGGLAFDQL